MDLLYQVIHLGATSVEIGGRNVSKFGFNWCSKKMISMRTPMPWPDDGRLYCNSTWDTVSCWPTTLAGELAILPCPTEFDGMRMHPEGNSSRLCLPDGAWQNRSDYSQCKPLQNMEEEEIILNFILRVIYYVGFSVSIVALLISLFIFLYFKSLMCLRNRIHCHLIVTFLARYILWIIMNIALPSLDQTADKVHMHHWICRTIVSIHRYFQMTNFYWMLVEGLYLHTVIVWAFSVERVKFWYYGVLGWVVPAVFTLVWVILKAKIDNNTCWLPGDELSSVEYSQIVPILVVLVVNVIFMCSIIWVLVTKLRASNTLQTRLYRKAVRATTILLPLLGLTYMLMITSPGSDPISVSIYMYFNAVLQSSQGLVVAVCYCFMNGEVRAVIRQRFSRWQEGRTIATRYTRTSIATNVDQIDATSRVNGRASLGSAQMSREYIKNNNTNGVNHMAIPMLSLNDEAL